MPDWNVEASKVKVRESSRVSLSAGLRGWASAGDVKKKLVAGNPKLGPKVENWGGWY